MLFTHAKSELQVSLPACSASQAVATQPAPSNPSVHLGAFQGQPWSCSNCIQTDPSYTWSIPVSCHACLPEGHQAVPGSVFQQAEQPWHQHLQLWDPDPCLQLAGLEQPFPNEAACFPPWRVKQHSNSRTSNQTTNQQLANNLKTDNENDKICHFHCQFTEIIYFVLANVHREQAIKQAN